MKIARFALPSFLSLAACSGVDPIDEPLGTAEQAQAGDDECSVSWNFTVLSEGAFAASVILANDDDDPSVAWVVRWEFTEGEELNSFFSANIVQRGSEVTARNVDFNGGIPGGESVLFGVSGTVPDRAQIPDDLECTLFR